MTKRQKAALEKLEQISNNVRNEPLEDPKVILEAVASATKKILSETKPIEPLHPATSIAPSLLTPEKSENEKGASVDSAESDLENEPIQKKRERQRSLVLNLGKTS